MTKKTTMVRSIEDLGFTTYEGFCPFCSSQYGMSFYTDTDRYVCQQCGIRGEIFNISTVAEIVIGESEQDEDMELSMQEITQRMNRIIHREVQTDKRIDTLFRGANETNSELGDSQRDIRCLQEDMGEIRRQILDIKQTDDEVREEDSEVSGFTQNAHRIDILFNRTKDINKELASIQMTIETLGDDIRNENATREQSRRDFPWAIPSGPVC